MNVACNKAFLGGLVAQSVEHRPFKAVVPGSSPGQPTIFLTPSVGNRNMQVSDCDSRMQDPVVMVIRSKNSVNIITVRIK